MFYDIAVCDDDAAFAADFAARLDQALDAKSVDCKVTTFSDPDALLRAVTGGQRYALLFLDVLFGDAQRGLDLAGTLRSAGCDADIIFMSVTPEFAAASFDAAPPALSAQAGGGRQAGRGAGTLFGQKRALSAAL